MRQSLMSKILCSKAHTLSVYLTHGIGSRHLYFCKAMLVEGTNQVDVLENIWLIKGYGHLDFYSLVYMTVQNCQKGTDNLLNNRSLACSMT